MLDKISAWGCVKDACRLAWARKWTFVGVEAVVVIAMMAITLVPGVTVTGEVEDLNAIGASFIVSFLLLMLVSVVAGTVLLHLGVTYLRGRAQLMPDNLVSATGAVIVRGLILFVCSMVLMLGLALPVFVVASFVPEGVAQVALMGLIAVVGGAFIYTVILRLGMMIPGAAVGEKLSIREAMELTKGHGLRILGSILILGLGLVILAFVLFLPLALVEQGGEPLVLGAAIVNAVIQLVYGILTITLLAVWYEKLRQRPQRGAVQGNDAPMPPYMNE